MAVENTFSAELKQMKNMVYVCIVIIVVLKAVVVWMWSTKVK